MTSTTRLWLVRHGQTDWNLAGRYQGQADIPLNETGRQQAQTLAASLAGVAFDAVYSSDLSRAHQTALALTRPLGTLIRLEPRLREIHQGEWEGMLLSEIRAARSDGGTPHHDSTHWRAPGGESVIEVAARVAKAADEISRRFPGGQVLVVGHGLCLATLICQSRGLPLACVYEHVPENCAPVEIAWPPTRS